MALTRRKFLAGSAATAAVAVGVGLRPEEMLRWSDRPRMAWAAGRTAAMPAPPLELHLLNRATFGATRGELDRIMGMGLDSWLDEQLAPATIDDSAVDADLQKLPSLAWSVAEIKANRGKVPIRNQLLAGTMYRMVASRRQLFEVMVDHWSSHFNLFHVEEFIAAAKTVDDRAVVRANAMGKFRDMLHASAASPAMLRYLNTFQNTKIGPNENYGREVMELHTLGVDGGYTEADVKQVARCFTGWNMDANTWDFQFRAADHDTTQKTVLGHPITGTGADEGKEVLDILVGHPECARHVARRMIRRLVSDTPSEALVDVVAAEWRGDGDIRAMVSALFRSNLFAAAYVDPTANRSGSVAPSPAKIKRPLELWAGVLRTLGVNLDFMFDVPPDNYEGEGGDSNYADRAERYLQLMDQVPFRWAAPNGYPDEGAWWGGMHVMVSRWNYALAVLENRLDGITLDLYAQMTADGIGNRAEEVVDYWTYRVLLRPILPQDRAILVDFLTRGVGSRVAPELLAERLPMLLALMFDSPYFQWR